jgi:hypothetical protein
LVFEVMGERQINRTAEEYPKSSAALLSLKEIVYCGISQQNNTRRVTPVSEDDQSKQSQMMFALSLKNHARRYRIETSQPYRPRPQRVVRRAVVLSDPRSQRGEAGIERRDLGLGECDFAVAVVAHGLAQRAGQQFVPRSRLRRSVPPG